jgi:hypothetical protein
MAVIHEKGLLEGKRLRRCTPLARLFWPYLYCLSNGLCRIELDCELLADKLLTFRDMAPDAEQITEMFAGFEKNHLIYIYQFKDQRWGQWDFVDTTDIKRHPTKEEQRSPQPPEPGYTEWLQEQHGEDWESHSSTLVSTGNTTEFETKREGISRKRSEAGRKGGLAKAGRLNSLTEDEESGRTEAKPGNNWQPEANSGNSSLGIGNGDGHGIGHGLGHGLGDGLPSAMASTSHLDDESQIEEDTTAGTKHEQHDRISISNELARHLFNSMEQYNPKAISNAPEKWQSFWSSDIQAMLDDFTPEDTWNIISESQKNPKFKPMVVRGAGLVKMAARIHAHILKNGHYQPKASGHPNSDPFSKEIEEFNDDDAFSTKGFEVEPAVPIPFNEEL